MRGALVLKRAGVLALLMLAVACPKAPESGVDAGAVAAEFAPIRIADDSQGLLFTYLLADGSFATVEKSADVPKEARDQVIVVDTGLSPDKRRSSQVLYVADLNTKRPDGTYRYSLVSRFKFERDLLRAPAQHTSALPPECQQTPPSPEDRVVLYSTDWCGVCKTAAAFMRKEGLPFEEKDIERDPAAQRELSCKALKAGTRLSGVPVLDVAGTLMNGFDRDQLLELAKKLKPSKAL